MKLIVFSLSCFIFLKKKRERQEMDFKMVKNLRKNFCWLLQFVMLDSKGEKRVMMKQEVDIVKVYRELLDIFILKIERFLFVIVIKQAGKIVVVIISVKVEFVQLKMAQLLMMCLLLIGKLVEVEVMRYGKCEEN